LSRLPCAVWERLPGTPLNQLLAAACACIRRDAVMRAGCGIGLGQLAAVLSGVAPRVERDLLNGKLPLRRNELPFELACTLARLIVRATGMTGGSAHEGF